VTGGSFPLFNWKERKNNNSNDDDNSNNEPINSPNQQPLSTIGIEETLEVLLLMLFLD